MHGQQYALWEVDEAPLPSELAAKQPKFFPVYCKLCNTLMHGRPEQVGKKLKCPDCGTKTLIEAPKEENHSDSIQVPDGEEYQLDEAQELPERPSYVPYKVQQLSEFEQKEERLKQEYRDRQEIPAIPLIQGVHRMLLRSPLPESIFALAFFFALEYWFIENARANVTGLELIFVLGGYAISSFVGLIILIGASAYWLAVLKESSEGNDRLYAPPGPVFLDWAGECFFLVFAAAMSQAPGLLLWRFVPNLPDWAGPAAVSFCVVVIFPVFLLSQLENGSPFEFVSLKVVKTLFRNPFAWLLFFSETILLLAGSGAAIVALYLYSTWTLALSVTLAAAASFLYFRLLGRLAWWLSELQAVGEESGQ